jgi:hypothetical protein
MHGQMNVKRTCELKSSIAMALAALNKKAFLQLIRLKLSKKPIQCYIWSIALCGAETLTFGKVDQKCLGCFETWCCRRMEKISWADRVRNEEVLHRDKEERNVLRTVKIRKGNWIGYSWRGKCFLKHVFERKKAGNSRLLNGPFPFPR